jgi:hypothetical protein
LKAKHRALAALYTATPATTDTPHFYVMPITVAKLKACIFAAAAYIPAAVFPSA